MYVSNIFLWNFKRCIWNSTHILKACKLLNIRSFNKLEQPECLHSEDTPLPPHEYPYYSFILDPMSDQDNVKVTNLKNLPKLNFFKFWHKRYTEQIVFCCLIRCVNIKRVLQVLLKIQSGHDSVNRWTDGRMDRRTDGQCQTSIPPFNFVEARGIITLYLSMYTSNISYGISKGAFEILHINLTHTLKDMISCNTEISWALGIKDSCSFF